MNINSLESWTGVKKPEKTKIIGSYCVLEPLELEKHANSLFNVFKLNELGYRYLRYGPFNTLSDFKNWINYKCLGEDPIFYTILDNNNTPVGLSSYLRIDTENGVIEVGHLHFSIYLKKTRAATEAMYLMMYRVFEELGYRRYEWKCDSLNVASRNAAKRLGFKFEGLFRQYRFYKGQNCDTAWYSIIDKEWPQIKNRLELWLSPTNFDINGNQIVSLKNIS